MMRKITLIFIVQNLQLQIVFAEICTDGSIKDDVIFNQNFTGVSFDPFTTDNFLLFDDLGEADISILLQKIHTKFKKISIYLSGGKNDTGYTKKLSELTEVIPIAVAKLNRDYIKAKPMTVTISVSVSSSQEDYIVKYLQEMIPTIYSIYDGTVEYLSLDIPDVTDENVYQLIKLRNLIETSFVNRRFQIAFQIEQMFCQKYLSERQAPQTRFASLFSQILSLHRDMTYIILGFNVELAESANVFGLVIQYFNSCAGLLKDAYPEGNLGLMLKIVGDETYGVTNFTNFVNSWKIMDEIAGKLHIPIILNQAFDSSFITPLHASTTGWWRIKPSRKYQNASDFKFEEKICLRDKEIGREFENANLTKLNEDKIIRQKFVGVTIDQIIFSGLENKTNVEEFVEIILTKFSILTILVSGTIISKLDFESVAKVNSRTEQGKIDVIVLFDRTNIKDLIEFANAGNHIFPETYKRFVYNGVNEVGKGMKEINLVKTFKQLYSNYSWEITLPLNKCRVDQLREFQRLGLDLIIFIFETLPSLTTVGIERNLGWQTAMLETCKMRVASWLDNTELFFIVSWQTKTEAGYLDLITYWENISEWANETETRVIFEKGIDFNPISSRKYHSGWWTMMNANPFKVESKKEAALRIARDKLPRRYKGNTTWVGMFIGLAAVFVLFLITLAITVYLLRKRKNGSLTRMDLQEFFYGDAGSSIEGHEKFNEVSKDAFKLIDTIGKARFGEVWLGRMDKNGHEEQVAVKMTKKACPIQELKGLMSEIKTLVFLGKQENIVELLGAYTSELRKSVVYIFLEFCELGSLESYLKTIASEIEEGNEIGSISKQIENDMVKWALEIASGMEYIADKKVVHTDLASHNVLLSSNKVAKISNFKLSRRLSKYEMYVKTTYENFPWRWMAPEALRRFEFTEKTDVWAFGVTLWEIFSLGDLPYSGLVWDKKFENYLLNGLRLGIPKYNKREISSAMTSCWARNPEDRPSFSELRSSLQIYFSNLESLEEGDGYENEFDVLE